MEAILKKMRKLLPGSSAVGSSQPSAQAATPTRPKEMSQKAFKEMKAHIEQRKVQEALVEATKIEVLVLEVRPAELPTAKPAVVPAAIPTTKAKKTEKDLDTKMTSSKPSSQKKSERKKKKEPTLESEDEEESMEETRSFGGDEEEEPVTHLPEKKPQMGTRSTNQEKKPESSFKTPGF